MTPYPRSVALRWSRTGNATCGQGGAGGGGFAMIGSGVAGFCAAMNLTVEPSA